MKVKKKTRVICGIIFVAVLIAALFVKHKLFDGKLSCTGFITDHIGEWKYDSDCFIVEESKTGGPWIVYESLEEINERFHKDLTYGDRVWISYTTDGYEIAPQQMDVVHIIELRNNRKPAFKTDNISKIWSKFGPWEEVEVPSEDIEEITEWLETFKIGNRVRRRETQPAGTNSVSVKIEYSDGTIVENGLSTMKIGKKEFHLIYANVPKAYWRLYDSIGR
jgi:hypothetical protein